MDTDIMTRIEDAQEHWSKAVIFDEQLSETVALLNDAKREIEQLNIQHREAEPLLNELWERRTEATEMRAEIERQRKILEWLLPQLFRRIYPEYDLGHPHMYTLITAVKQPDGGMPKDMWKTIRPFLDAKP